ncbi:RND superfamily putative drug exporter [Kribbella amoyensis]|uniref:RND superfamily putative drug exporter n=1 Tax=Kribbella amoyensis TaxID=996641 RepID=A0A561BT35_9ACTN|nr:MMPL family transporter [Kribbella amoyensis]TWD82026.1 RND superfamily putative drug exporter [Kribbella amoyensis]
MDQQGSGTDQHHRAEHKAPRRKSGRWAWRAAIAAVLVGWLVLGALGGPTVGRLSEVQENDNANFLPKQAESTLVADQAAKFVDSRALPYFVLIERESGITADDLVAAKGFLAKVGDLDLGAGKKLGDYLAAPAQQVIPSEDRKALLLTVELDGDKADEVVTEGETVLFAAADSMRTEIKQSLTPTGLQVYVTGPGGVFADFVVAFGGIDGILLGVALAVVFVILLIVYRSPVLPIAVLLTAVFGLALAALVVYPLAENDVIELNGQSQGILFILVVGAATDYSLLLVSRYKEELHDYESKFDAMRVAWRASIEPIAASAATVILGLLCLLLSQLGSTKGLGPVGAIGIAGALISAMTFLPAVLLAFGRRIFWPSIPKLDHVHASDQVGGRKLWGRVSGLVGRSPRKVWAITALALLACGAFLPTFKASGISQEELFLDKVESVTGQEQLAKHFDAGAGTPVQILTPQGKATQVIEIASQVDGVGAAAIGAAPGTPPKVVEGNVLVQATLEVAADSPEATKVVEHLRTELDKVGPEVLVGGTTAINLDVLDASERDLRVIIPAILLVIFVVLMLLLRSITAAVLLVVANVISFAATVGVSALVFNHVFGFPGADPSIPLYAFVFLVALGIDYSIFLMTRVREESIHQGTRPGILVGLAVTGGVITSAGVVLAATFSALAVLPILFLVQIAFMVAFGVLLDTTVVRSLLVPALSYDLGRKVWWPSKLARAKQP